MNWEDPISYSLFDHLGKEVIREKGFSSKTGKVKETINLNELKSGLYFLKVQSKQGAVVKKVVVNH
jgi:hypothetical protein